MVRTCYGLRMTGEARQIPCTVCAMLVEASGHQLKNWQQSGNVYCGPECVRAMRQALGAQRRQQRGEAPCTQCGVSVRLADQPRHRLTIWRDRGRAYCSDACRDVWTSARSAEVLAETNRQHASEHMKLNNPMANVETRAKMAATLKRVGHAPTFRGGNGTQMPEPQAKLAALFGWPTEVVWAPKDGDRPYHYKMDIAHPTMRVCVEVDGGSHYSRERQESDARRDARMAIAGWLVFRFSNQEAMERTAECVQAVLSTTSRWRERIPTSSSRA